MENIYLDINGKRFDSIVIIVIISIFKVA